MRLLRAVFAASFLASVAASATGQPVFAQKRPVPVGVKAAPPTLVPSPQVEPAAPTPTPVTPTTPLLLTPPLPTIPAPLMTTPTPPIPVSAPAVCGVDMRVLVISADGTETGLPAITQTLEYLGTPYTLYVATQHPGELTSSFLGSGCHGSYQAVIQTTGDLGYMNGSTWTSALTSAELDTLHFYEAQFKVRQVTWYTWPNPTLGFDWGTGVDTTATPLTVKLTAAGKSVFPYINVATAAPSPRPIFPVSPTLGIKERLTTPAAPIVIRNAYTYLARPLSASTVPLVTDASENALMAVTTFADGRENLAMTFDSNPYLLHTLIFDYGVINWATQGLFVGERRVYMSPQIDDVFIDDEQWIDGMSCSLVGHDRGPNDFGPTVRMTGHDLSNVAAWQFLKNLQPTTAGLRLTMAINGWGATGQYPHDTLTKAAKSLDPLFYWISHTYDHPMLDGIGYPAARDEFTMNNDVAKKLKLGSYSTASIVTPNVSGLHDAAVMQAAADVGIKYLVTDTSVAGQDNPSPNVGIYNWLQPKLLMIPRRPVNLFYNVTTPVDWASEYNCLYHSYFGRDLTYQEILEFVSNQLLPYLLRGENDPWMFHQPNLVAYAGGRTLLTDLLDATLAKYNAYFTLPIVSPSMDALGANIAARMARISAHVTATVQRGVSVTISSDQSVTVPVTGLAMAGAETYGGQPIAWVKVPAGTSVTLPISR